jgi:hypothetical protein
MNPLFSLFEQGLPALDIGVMEHGLAKHGRDYVFILEDCISHRPGTYRLTFTHIVEMTYETALSPSGWLKSWSDDFIDYKRWEDAGEPEGYVFGTDWSLAYPGWTALTDDAAAASWTEKLGRPVHAASLETDRFKLKLVFSDARLEQLSENAPTVRRVIFPM